jgi:hypothetical protein
MTELVFGMNRMSLRPSLLWLTLNLALLIQCLLGHIYISFYMLRKMFSLTSGVRLPQVEDYCSRLLRGRLSVRILTGRSWHSHKPGQMLGWAHQHLSCPLTRLLHDLRSQESTAIASQAHNGNSAVLLELWGLPPPFAPRVRP